MNDPKISSGGEPSIFSLTELPNEVSRPATQESKGSFQGIAVSEVDHFAGHQQMAKAADQAGEKYSDPSDHFGEMKSFIDVTEHAAKGETLRTRRDRVSVLGHLRRVDELILSNIKLLANIDEIRGMNEVALALIKEEPSGFAPEEWTEILERNKSRIDNIKRESRSALRESEGIQSNEIIEPLRDILSSIEEVFSHLRSSQSSPSTDTSALRDAERSSESSQFSESKSDIKHDNNDAILEDQRDEQGTIPIHAESFLEGEGWFSDAAKLDAPGASVAFESDPSQDDDRPQARQGDRSRPAPSSSEKTASPSFDNISFE